MTLIDDNDHRYDDGEFKGWCSEARGISHRGKLDDE